MDRRLPGCLCQASDATLTTLDWKLPARYPSVRVVDPVAVAAALIAVLQGGYVLARAADSAGTYMQAVEGALALLACRTRTGEDA